MMIENYYMPDGLNAAIEANADRTGNTQFVALCHHHRYVRAAVNLGDILTPHPIFDDFRTGQHCSWVYGPGYAALKQLDDVAVILHVKPDYKKIAASRVYGTPEQESAAYGYGQGRYQGD